jgi:hypothetical protein
VANDRAASHDALSSTVVAPAAALNWGTGEVRNWGSEKPGADRHSIGRVPTVVREVLHRPALISALGALTDTDGVVRIRAADALEKVTAAHPDLLRRWTTGLLRLAVDADQQEVRWHPAQILPRLRLTQRQRAIGRRVMREYLTDRSSIVRTFVLQALLDLSENDRRLRRRVDACLRTPLALVRPRCVLASAASSRVAPGRAQSRWIAGHPARGDTPPAPTPKRR